MIGQHLKTTELAQLLSLNPETLRRAAARGDLKPIRIGRDLLWPEDEVRAWLDRNRVDNSRVVPIRRQTPPSTTRRRSA